MTPYEIGILLHYYCRAEDHDDLSRNPPVWRPTIDQFLHDELLTTVGTRDDMCYALTERGRAYVERLQSIGLPQWGYPS